MQQVVAETILGAFFGDEVIGVSIGREIGHDLVRLVRTRQCQADQGIFLIFVKQSRLRR